MKIFESYISVDRISKTYNAGTGKVHALNGISFDIHQGEFIAIMGPSGSGKSTLVSVLGGISHPTKGKIIVDGIDVYDLPAERLADFRREYLGFVFQSFQLVTYLTVCENVLLPLTVTRYSNAEQKELATSILEKVGLAAKTNRLPDELSGGEQQRVAIARALVNQPPIILADEPTGNLDSATSEEIMHLLVKLNDEGQTIIIVTHNHDNLKYVNRCIKLVDGQVHQQTEYECHSLLSKPNRKLTSETY
ncbi:ABC transporter ATP-binding protein [bacterium]|nr:ABC transporter ATP-binding protein [bacterium]